MNRAKRRLAKSIWVLGAGLVFQIPFLGSCETLLTVFNPCGSIFGFCQPTDIDLLFADIPDFDLDPSCTIPFAGINTGSGGNCANEPVFPSTPGPRP